MKRLLPLLAIALMFSAASGRAEVTLTLKTGLELDWYYHNTTVQYNHMTEIGFFKDYSGDGVPDYMILLKNSTSGNWRLFALDSVPTGGEKTYSADKTAGRDFTAQAGLFMPYRLFTPRADSMDLADLVLVSTDEATPSGGDFTRLTFQRLDENNSALPDESAGRWTIDGVNKDMTLTWSGASFDGDDYPDFFIYTRLPNASQQFVVTCYNGLTGASIWSKT
ncbi:hypothetical protein HQ520_18560, partial [bacterium]|nr:hypothetical protein [bacterium]